MKVNQIISSAIVCLGFVLVGGCGDSGPVGQEAVNPAPEDSSHEDGSDAKDGSDDQVNLESDDEG